MMDPTTRVLLIGGSSHTGKSTAARMIAARLEWDCLSTDSLARHPGRPWRPPGVEVPPHVAEHYLTFSIGGLLAAVDKHYRESVWPLAAARIAEACSPAAPRGLVVEGSALLPDLVVGLRAPGVAAVWLVAPPDVFETRIHRESGYATADARGRPLIDKFLGRTRAFDLALREGLARLELPCIDIQAEVPPEAVADQCLSQMRPVA